MTSPVFIPGKKHSPFAPAEACRRLFSMFRREIWREIYREFCSNKKSKVSTVVGANFRAFFVRKFVAQASAQMARLPASEAQPTKQLCLDFLEQAQILDQQRTDWPQRNHLETNLASRWEGVRLPRASGKSPDFPRSSSLPLGPKLLHHITLFFRINFPDYVISLYITESVSNYFLGHVISCVVAKHIMWTSDCITWLFSN